MTDSSLIAENYNTEGCPAGQKKEVEVNLLIPTQDPFPPEFLNKLHPDLHPMLSSFSSSIRSNLITVEYFLVAKVDHGEWSFIGTPGTVTMPV